MTFGQSKEEQLKKEAVQKMILWMREIEEKAKQQEMPQNVWHTVIVAALMEGLGSLRIGLQKSR